MIGDSERHGVGETLCVAQPRKKPDLPSQSPEEIRDIMLGTRGVHVIGVDDELKVVRVVIETFNNETVCPSCATPAVLFDRPVREIHDLPAFDRDLIFEWHLKRWQCPNHRCAIDQWDEELPPVGSAQGSDRREK